MTPVTLSYKDRDMVPNTRKNSAIYQRYSPFQDNQKFSVGSRQFTGFIGNTNFFSGKRGPPYKSAERRLLGLFIVFLALNLQYEGGLGGYDHGRGQVHGPARYQINGLFPFPFLGHV